MANTSYLAEQSAKHSALTPQRSKARTIMQTAKRRQQSMKGRAQADVIEALTSTQTC